MKLATSTAPIGTTPLKPAAPTPTVPGVGAAAPTLPRATIQLQPPTQAGTKPLTGGLAIGGPSLTKKPTLVVEEEEEEEENMGVKVLAGIGMVAALAVLTFQLLLAKKWIDVEDNPRVGDWSQVLETPE